MAITKRFPSDKADQYIVRFPDGMRDLIKSEAEKNGRSMNAEIVARISRTLIEDENLPKYIQRHEDLERDRFMTVRRLNKIESQAESLLKEIKTLLDEGPLDSEEK